MQLKSFVFEHQGSIPKLYSCQGSDINPPLEISAVPEGAISLALIMDDPDVPPEVRADCMYDHWVVFNIDPKTTSIAEDAPPFGTLGRNSGGEDGYIGPCPPDKEHRYFFKLYALDSKIDLPKGATKKEVEAQMEGHILAKCELIGLFVKS
ncbi:MAG: hypothetical protein S4CHLAM81_12880 [Chlamydiales bacterium]|nr:hypothetical protein [Chlamydiales bacterium]MCH9636063.1 hypothetical protein [Chlamydiales bacterium]MCH9703226.1 YbhB/YbcL family Raf kinase inhibitor-like protein [Chlamydiota bacterium]